MFLFLLRPGTCKQRRLRQIVASKLSLNDFVRVVKIMKEQKVTISLQF